MLEINAYMIQKRSSNFIYVHGLTDKLQNESPQQTYQLLLELLELSFGLDIDLNSFEILNVKRIGKFSPDSERIVRIQFNTLAKKNEFLKFVSTNSTTRSLIRLYDKDNLFVIKHKDNLNTNRTLHDTNSSPSKSMHSLNEP